MDGNTELLQASDDLGRSRCHAGRLHGDAGRIVELRVFDESCRDSAVKWQVAMHEERPRRLPFGLVWALSLHDMASFRREDPTARIFAIVTRA